MPVTKDSKKLKSTGPIVYSKNGINWYLPTDHHSLTISDTGTGKTIRKIAPQIDVTMRAGHSMIITDPKFELYKMFSNKLKKNGYKIVTINMFDVMYGNRFNPYTVPTQLYNNNEIELSDMYIHDNNEIMYNNLSENTQDNYWSSEASDYCNGLCHLARKENKSSRITFEDLRNLNTQSSIKINCRCDYMSRYLDIIDKNSLIYQNLNNTVNNAEETKKNIKSTFAQPFNRYALESIKDFTYESDFNMEDIAYEKTVIFLILPSYRSYFNILISIFIKQSYSVLVDCVADRREDGKLSMPVSYFLDEFGVLPKINDFDNIIATARGKNIFFHLVIQSYKQLEDKYKNKSDIIFSNCRLLFIFSCRDLILQKKLEESSGYYETKYGHKEKKIIEASMLQSLDSSRGEVCIIYKNKPFVTVLPVIYDECYGNYKLEKINIRKRKPILREKIDLASIIKGEENNMKDELNEIFKDDKVLEALGLSRSNDVVENKAQCDSSQISIDEFQLLEDLDAF